MRLQVRVQFRSRALPRQLGLFLLLFLMGNVSVQTVQAQGEAAISGTVTDSSGSAIPDAAVAVQNIETGAVRNIASDAEGRYDAPLLPIGSYKVSVEKSGFQSQSKTGITLVVGQAISGGFLTHGYQANRILAFDDSGVVIHAMHKEAAARITLRTVADLERLGHDIAPLSYDVRDYARLGLLHKLLHVENPDTPSQATVALVQKELIEAVTDARAGSRDLSNRFNSEGARQTRKAGLRARTQMEHEWATA